MTSDQRIAAAMPGSGAKARAAVAVLLAAGLAVAGCTRGVSDPPSSPASGPSSGPASSPASSPASAPADGPEIISGEFTDLRVADGFQVQVRPGEQSRATVEVAGIPPGEVSAEIRGGTLELRSASGTVPPGAKLEARVEMPELGKVIASSGATVRLQSDLVLGAPDALVDLTAGASLRGRVEADDLDVRLQAGAGARLSGSAASANIVGAESGTLEGVRLEVGRADVALSSGAAAEITVTDSLVVSLSSGGELRYAGDPESVAKTVEPGTTLAPISK